MDRRNFTKFALSGLALSVLPDTMGKAAIPAAPMIPAAPRTAPAPPYAALLERAKASLDPHAHSSPCVTGSLLRISPRLPNNCVFMSSI